MFYDLQYGLECSVKDHIDAVLILKLCARRLEPKLEIVLCSNVFVTRYHLSRTHPLTTYPNLLLWVLLSQGKFRCVKVRHRPKMSAASGAPIGKKS